VTPVTPVIIAGQDLSVPAAARRLLGFDAAKGSSTAANLGAAPDAGGALALDPWVMARLLEDGDRADLAWLCGRLGEETLAAWLELHGARRLSRRSLAFWAVLLDRPGLRPERLPALARRRELWPL
jgi:hypothetical protein